jgi:hypothetical protein
MFLKNIIILIVEDSTENCSKSSSPTKLVLSAMDLS